MCFSEFQTCTCLQDLYQRCEKMRPTLFRLASDTEDSDEALGKLADIMTVSKDEYNKAFYISCYWPQYHVKDWKRIEVSLKSVSCLQRISYRPMTV